MILFRNVVILKLVFWQISVFFTNFLLNSYLCYAIAQVEDSFILNLSFMQFFYFKILIVCFKEALFDEDCFKPFHSSRANRCFDFKRNTWNNSFKAIVATV